LPDARWRAIWDGILCFSGVVACLVFGVAMGNLLLGLPFGVEPATLRPVYEGNLFQLFMPFALLAGVFGVPMLAVHAPAPLAGRAACRRVERDDARRARRCTAGLAHWRRRRRAVAQARRLAGAGDRRVVRARRRVGRIRSGGACGN